jgi:hypothetical protein
VSTTTDTLTALNAGLRAAVEARLAGQPQPQRTDTDTAPPPEIVALYPGAEFAAATVVETPRFDQPILATASMPTEQLTASARAMRRVVTRERSPRGGARLIGITGRAGAGKNLVASMIPGAVVIGLADPLYAMLSVMLGIPGTILRSRDLKERPLPWVGCSIRHMLQTLGTEWGRERIAGDIWVRLLERQITDLESHGIRTIAVADIRFGNEADFIRSRGGEVWVVRRPGTDTPATHVSEAGGVKADKTIENDGTVDELRAQVVTLLEEVGRG